MILPPGFRLAHCREQKMVGGGVLLILCKLKGRERAVFGKPYALRNCFSLS